MSRMRFGVYAELEQQADRLIAQSLQGVTRHSAKADILTPWKTADRRRREILVPTGIPDPAKRQGMYHRAANTAMPHLNSRPGGVLRDTGLHAFMDEHRREGTGRG